MAIPIQGQNRGEIRRLIGPALGIMQVGAATSTTATTNLTDTLYLRGADDEHNGKQLLIFDPAGSITAGAISFVSDFTGSTNNAVCAPAFTAAITTGDDYELWNTPWVVSDVNKAIDEAIIAASTRALVKRVTDSNFTLSSRYEYDWLVPYAFGNDFRYVYMVEYVSSVGTQYDIHDCDTVWDELVDTDVTASVDTSIEREGSGCLKLVVADGCAAGDILATMDISSLDITGCDSLEIWIYSTVALDAGDLQVLLDDTALCAGPLESLSIPATSVNTWTRHVIDLADAPNDSAIISVGLKMVTDKGAFTLYADDIKATLAASKIYKELNPEYWSIVTGDSPKLKLTSAGLSVVGANTQVRLSGFSSPDLMTDETTDAEIDPDFITNYVKGLLMTGHAKSRTLDIENRQDKGEKFMALALSKLNRMIFSPTSNCRSV